LQCVGAMSSQTREVPWAIALGSYVLLYCVMRLKLPATADMTILFQGYNGSQLWDTAFAIQAIISTNLVEEYSPTLKRAHAFVKNSQV